MRPDRLPRPADDALDTSLWIDEAIWGHRLYDEQVPWLALLEMLGILCDTSREGHAFKEPTGLNRLSYGARRALYLRNIVFNNPGLATVSGRAPDDKARWALWRQEMAGLSSGVHGAKYDYLETRFDTFDDFASLIQLLRATAIEGSSNKRWTSKFIFPYGPDCLYEDLRLDDQGASNDRRFFARTGELLYLMLSRSGRSEELLERLTPLFLSRESRWNRLVAVLEPAGDGGAGRARSSAFLPYTSLRDFAALATDWLALLDLKLPGYDVLPHLVDLLGLHLLLYFLRRAADWATAPEPVRLVLEIVAPKRSTVRDLSIDSFQRNSLLSKQAVANFIEDEVVADPRWAAASSSSDPFGQAMAFVFEKTAWQDLRPGKEEYSGQRTPTALLEGLRTTAQRRHAQHLANFHSSYARAIGLASKRGTRGLRYAPNDLILKSLVFAVVPRRMEFQQFLEVLYERYCLVIGHRQASELIGADSDRRAFEENARRLEMRLGSLGLLRRLSDACAYVENPFGGVP